MFNRFCKVSAVSVTPNSEPRVRKTQWTEARAKLTAFDDETRGTLKEDIRSALTDFTKRKREFWFELFPAQVILVANQVYSINNLYEYSYEKQMTLTCHSIILECLQFGSVGWNIPSEFNFSDFYTSKHHLYQFLVETTQVPDDALSYVIEELEYGRRIIQCGES
jgi:hypothetical protein